MNVARSFQPARLVETPGAAADSRHVVRLRCPLCSQSMGVLRAGEPASELRCPSCGYVMVSQNAIWSALAPVRAQRFRQFIKENEAARAKESHGSPAADFYLALPRKDLSGRNSREWKMRHRSFGFFERRILPKLESEHPEGLDLLDIGGGNCWLSYRLALRGHRPVAIDLLTNDEDGLGAARHYLAALPHPFPRFQAEMDRMPFEDAQFDLAVFSSSFHYSEEYARTLHETLRCLRRPGCVLIMGTPIYQSEESGRKMLAQEQAEVQKRYGFRPDSLPSPGFLTAATLQELAQTDGSAWKIYKPWFGRGWALRPLKANLLARGEAAKFFILWGRTEHR